MANRYICFMNTLLHEDGSLSGVVVKDSNGYLVRWGINQKSWPSVDVSSLSFQDAIRICYQKIWPHNLELIRSQTVENAVFDLEFNNGARNGVKMLQRALGLKEDGMIGVKTVEAANADPDLTSKMLEQTISDHYRKIAQAQPSEAVYLDNWLARVRGNFAVQYQ